MANKAPKRTVTRHKWHRLPNGFGSIRKFNGNRRNPYGAYPAIKDYKDNGTAIQPPAIGYYPTWQLAYDALVEYNKKPYDLKNDRLTFADIYKLYYADKYEKSKKEYSEASKNSTSAAFNNYSKLHNVNFKSLKTADLQAEIDSCNLKHASLELMVSLVKGMYRFAMQNDLADKDYGRYVKINIGDDDENGVPFTESEINILWSKSSDIDAKRALVLIYTGMRIKELQKANIDVKQGVIVTGVKTDAGKNRIIPIHSLIKEFVTEIDLTNFKDYAYRQSFKEMLTRLNILTSSQGTIHTPHDCRHTFSWLADKYKMDSLSKHLIMGHSTKNLDIEQSTYGHRTVEELKTEIEKIKSTKNI